MKSALSDKYKNRKPYIIHLAIIIICYLLPSLSHVFGNDSRPFWPVFFTFRAVINHGDDFSLLLFPSLSA